MIKKIKIKIKKEKERKREIKEKKRILLNLAEKLGIESRDLGSLSLRFFPTPRPGTLSVTTNSSSISSTGLPCARPADSGRFVSSSPAMALNSPVNQPK